MAMAGTSNENLGVSLKKREFWLMNVIVIYSTIVLVQLIYFEDKITTMHRRLPPVK
jgi:hypothetical protein